MSGDLSGARLVLAGGAGCAAALWLSLLLTRAPLAELASARAQDRTYREALASGPVAEPDLIAAGGAIVAADRGAACARLADQLAARALRAGLLVEAKRSARGAAGDPAAVELAVSGSESAVLRFVADSEAERPLVRFRNWTIERSPGGAGLRFGGTATALWQPAR